MALRNGEPAPNKGSVTPVLDAGRADPSPNGRRRPGPTFKKQAGATVHGSREFAERFAALVGNVERVIHGKTDVVRLALVALFSGGHVLFEDVPGVGKSMLARAIGRSIDAHVARVQCTADMLPSDITGSSVLDQRTYDFKFRPGPLFANILLADEINRATPKTQSALLEAMAEATVTVDGITHPLPRPFLVLATQNPVELAGTFPLPEAQLDRFLFRLAMGYPSAEAETVVLRGNSARPEIDSLEPVMSDAEVLGMVDWATGVTVSDAVVQYIISLCTATRKEPALSLGAGPRASQALLWASRVLAASEGREDVYPDDVRAIFPAVVGHRVLLSPDALLRGDTIDNVVERILSTVKAPSAAAAARVQS
jgi:MoxR-like ATPase